MLNVLVAGASRGIGSGLVRVYLERGARVFAVARNPAGSAGLTELAAQHDERLQVVKCDLNTPAGGSVIVEALGGARLDRAIFNAGIHGPTAQDVATASEAEIGQLFFTNAVTPCVWRAPSARGGPEAPYSAS